MFSYYFAQHSQNRFTYNTVPTIFFKCITGPQGDINGSEVIDENKKEKVPGVPAMIHTGSCISQISSFFRCIIKYLYAMLCFLVFCFDFTETNTIFMFTISGVVFVLLIIIVLLIIGWICHRRLIRGRPTGLLIVLLIDKLHECYPGHNDIQNNTRQQLTFKTIKPTICITLYIV